MAAEMQEVHRSEAAQVTIPSLFRGRTRTSSVTFEQGKDYINVWLNTLNSFELCGLLEGLVQRCNINQLYFLWTTLESISHHDFLCHLKRMFPSTNFPPFSTPISRELKDKFKKSRRRENKLLHRVPSILINTETSRSISSQLSQLTPTITPTNIASTPLPVLNNRPSTAPAELAAVEKGRRMSGSGIRLLTPTRRHMTVTLTHIGTPQCYTVQSTTAKTSSKLTTRSSYTTPTNRKDSPTDALPVEVVSSHFFSWFTQLQKDWQQQDVLQTVVWSLNEKELYYLSALLLSRQYRDFIADLPEVISLKILSYVEGKDIMRSATVSKDWCQRCHNEKLWKFKCSQAPLGVPTTGIISWRRVFIDNIKLKRNWRLGNCVTSTFTSHTHRVLCVKVKEKEGICASGGSDRTIRIWSLRDGKLLNTIYSPDTKNIWCLCFYGINFIISGSGDSGIRIWNYRTGTCERLLQGHTSTIWSIKQKGDVLISGSNDKTAILWNIRQCQYMCHLIGHTGSVFDVDLDDSACIAITGSGDRTIRMWNVGDGQCIKVLSVSAHYPVLSLHYSKDYIVCATGTLISLWSATTGERLKVFKGHQERVECVHLLTGVINGDTIVSGSRDRLIKYWNINSGRCIRTLVGHSSTVNDIDRGNIYIVSGSDDHTLKVWDFYPK